MDNIYKENMIKIKKAMNYMCADASSVFPSWQKKRLKNEWINNRVLYKGITNEGDIVVTPVVIATDYHEIVYLMDCVTGSLYKDGKCKTSDHLKLLDFYTEKNIAKQLYAVQSKSLGA